MEQDLDLPSTVLEHARQIRELQEGMAPWNRISLTTREALRVLRLIGRIALKAAGLAAPAFAVLQIWERFHR